MPCSKWPRELPAKGREYHMLRQALTICQPQEEREERHVRHPPPAVSRTLRY